MNTINQGNNGSAIIGEKSKILNCGIKEKTKWFFSGFVLPIITGLIVELISDGKVSSFFQKIISIFSK